MKKLFFLLLVCGAMFTASAQDTTHMTTTTTTTTTHKYYYYPQSNVYYDESGNDYWYYDQPTSKWTMVETLPSTIVVDKTPRYLINYKGNDPWKDNAAHKAKYKMKHNGTVKTKPKH